MIPADFLPAFLGMIALATTPCWYAPWRPMAWPVCYTFAITMTSMIPAMPILIYIMHGTAGSAAKLSGAQRFGITVRYMQKKFGKTQAVVMLIGSFGIFYGAYAGVACAKACHFPVAPRIIVQRFQRSMRIMFTSCFVGMILPPSTSCTP